MKAIGQLLWFTRIALTAPLGLLFFAGASLAAPVRIVGHTGNGSTLETYDFATGGPAIASFATGNPDDRGRGVEVVGNTVYYASISGDIHRRPYNNGLGGPEILPAFPNPRPGHGIQDLDYAVDGNGNGILYALTGYTTGPPIVYALSPSDGSIMSSVPIQQHPDIQADGFTVLPNGDFLINDRDASATYRVYSRSSGLPITGSAFTVPGAIGGTAGVDLDPSDNTLYFRGLFCFSCGGSATTEIAHTDLSGTVLLGHKQIGFGVAAIEDISVISCVAPNVVGHTGNSSTLETYNFATGGPAIASFATGNPDNRGRGVEVVGNTAFYTSVSGDIHRSPYNNGLGGPEILPVFPNPRPGHGIQDLDYAADANGNGVLFALTGYLTGPPIVYALNPTDGSIISSVPILQHANMQADGFTVLPNGDFLINDGDASATYRVYGRSSGVPISGSAFTVPSAIGGTTGVDFDPNDNTLYFRGLFCFACGGSATTEIAQTDLTGAVLLGHKPIGFGAAAIEDISVISCVLPVPIPPASPTPSPTPTPTPTVPITNVSTRLRVLSGDNVGIVGFIITGTVPKHVLVRAIGPSLAQFGVPNVLADPVMDLHHQGAPDTIINDNWRDDPAQEAAILATGIPPTDNLESAIDAVLYPGAYTAVVRGKNNALGVALIEVYDLSQGIPAKLANTSTRAFVSTGDNIVIAGFILGGTSGNNRMVVRGIGPSLTAVGVPNALANPTLELRDSNGALLALNDDWQDDPAQAAELTAAGLAPTNPVESGIAAVLPPGLYTALLAGLNNGTGIGLVEVYARGGTP